MRHLALSKLLYEQVGPHFSTQKLLMENKELYELYDARLHICRVPLLMAPWHGEKPVLHSTPLTVGARPWAGPGARRWRAQTGSPRILEELEELTSGSGWVNWKVWTGSTGPQTVRSSCSAVSVWGHVVKSRCLGDVRAEAEGSRICTSV